MITTKQPTDDMIEVAIVSMEEALEADGEAVPAGSTEFERDPMKVSGDRPGRGPGDQTDPDRIIGGPGHTEYAGQPAAPDATGLDEKLAEVARQYDELGAELARPEVTSNPDALRRFGGSSPGSSRSSKRSAGSRPRGPSWPVPARSEKRVTRARRCGRPGPR